MKYKKKAGDFHSCLHSSNPKQTCYAYIVSPIMHKDNSIRKQLNRLGPKFTMVLIKNKNL